MHSSTKNHLPAVEYADVFASTYDTVKVGLCQVQIFSGSKSGSILDQGGKDGRAEVGLGQE